MCCDGIRGQGVPASSFTGNAGVSPASGEGKPQIRSLASGVRWAGSAGGSPASFSALRFAINILAILSLLPLTNCDEPSGDRGGNVEVRSADREIELSAVFHRGNAEKGTWHLLVHEDGSMGSLAYFTTDVTPLSFYEKLRALGFEARDTVSCETMGDGAASTDGDALEYFFTWEGGPRRLPLGELLVEALPEGVDAETKGLEMRFGGNHTGADAASPPAHESGCLACLYTCCAGVTSNSRANLALLRRENDWHRYRVNPKVGLVDGTKVRITIRAR